MSLISYFQRMIEHADLFDQMTEKVGVKDILGSSKGGAVTIRRAANRCISCEHGEACKMWLDETAIALEAPSFCSNHDLFTRVEEDIAA